MSGFGCLRFSVGSGRPVRVGIAMSTPRTYSIVVPENLRAFSGNPNYRKNQESARHQGHYVDQTECCVLCGRKAIGGNTFVILSNVSEYITKEESAAFDADCAARGGCSDDLGYYPVGSDCAKKLKSAGVPIYPAPAGF